MKKLLLLVVAIMFSVPNVFAAEAPGIVSATDTAKKSQPAKVIYTCPMHTDVVSYKPGKCPKPGCGMTLVKKPDTKKKPVGK